MTAPGSYRRLRLSPEFGCWPLWDDATGDCLGPEDWGLPPDLTARVTAWDAAFQATLDQDYPPDSRFSSPEAEAAWIAEGRAIAAALTAVLGPWGLHDRFSARSEGATAGAGSPQ